jgi:hypothetical protein
MTETAAGTVRDPVSAMLPTIKENAEQSHLRGHLNVDKCREH